MNAEHTQTKLSARMHHRAKQDGLHQDHALLVTARAFDRASAGFYARPQTIGAAGFVGAWGRARKAWETYSGERWSGDAHSS